MVVPIHHNVNSRKSGAGKTYDLILVTGYFPNRYVLSFVGMSDKALMHEEGVQVMVDKETGNTVFADPIIDDLKQKIEILETKLEDPKLQDPKYKAQKKDIKNQIKESEKEIKDIYKKCEKLIVLDNRIILLLDTAQEGLYNTLMSMMSQDTEKDQLYQFTDKNISGRLGATKNRLRGTPTLFTTQVIDDTRQIRYQEKNRRFIHVTPDTSSKKVSFAKRLIGQKYGLVPEEYDEKIVDRADKERAKEIVSIIVDKLIDHSKLLRPKESGVKIAFGESISHGMEDNSTEWSMTVMDRLMRYLTIITKVNMDFRPRILDTVTGKYYPISTFEDLKETLQLMVMASSILRPYLVEWYNRVFLPSFRELEGQPNKRYTDTGRVVESELYSGLTTEQLANKTFDILNHRINIENVRNQYLYPLRTLGIINIVKSSINGNEIIAFPVEDGSVYSIFEDERDLRLTITNYKLFPTKKLLEEAFRTFVKHDVREGEEKNINFGDRFRLVDHDGIDLSVNELIDRYLSNPLICFKNKEYEDMAETRKMCMYGYHPVRTNEEAETEAKNKNNFYPPACRRDLTEIPKNVIEESDNGNTTV